MSFVITAPEWIRSAAQDLASIRSALTEASAAAAYSTATITPAAADEVSSAIAALFGNFGREYQRVNTLAQAFHGEFVNVLKSSAGAYLGTELANARAAVALPANPISGLPEFPGFPGLPTVPGFGFSSSGTGWSAFTGPYEQLVINTTANLQSLGNGWTSNPVPFLRQVIANHTGYGEIVSTAFGNAMQEMGTGGAGPQAALTHLLPIGTIPGYLGQNAANLVKTIFDFSYSVGVDTATPAVGPAFFGFPVALGLSLIGSPVTTISAIGASAAAFSAAVQTGDFIGAAAALFTAPAVVANGFLNGQVMLGMSLPPLSLPLGQAPMALAIPLGGLLTPMSTTSVIIGPADGLLVEPQLTIPLGGTGIGGILPALLNWAPQQLAQAIGAPIPPQPPVAIPTVQM
ncbi:PE family protein [Mycobacterium bourgelatii]|uniref:PE domain-containing protein n=1 Tax=Mycobacterium bourgelatii TaxID=1273442 RepID=A0A7I9YTS7_MYCBU|nr:PE family protein [Mycobacterium bourgelatii]MCV6978444.1 PE family protein [Mycobacterium bourgelatii]GFG92090.1 hypothetical protein MBOU_41320 [Mycobacterium bourgelatii]